jgi:hypothetical protein
MTVYTYAFTLKGKASELELPEGIFKTVQLFSGDRVAAVVEPDVDVEALQSDDDRLLQAVLDHDRAICQLFRQTALLPLRFGTVFDSMAGLQGHLVRQEEAYFSALQRLAGKGEYALKFTPLAAPTPDMPAQTTGKAYLLAKKRRYQSLQNFRESQAAQWENIRSVITQNYPEAIAAEPRENTQRMYLLASVEEESLLHQRFRDWQSACPSWELHLEGALPPYHFL